ncbi:MAG: phosphatidate cytidylyltransferase [Bacteroidota bacterium]
MKELIVRGISGILYISIIIIAMFASREWFVALLFVLGLITINEFQKLVDLRSFVSFLIFPLLLFFLGYKVIEINVVYLYALVAIFVNLFLLRDLLVVHKIPMFQNKKYISLICYLMSGFVFLALIPNRENGTQIVIGLFILIWANDSFAYIIGKNFGKRKLLERISPKKTIVGFFGGLAGALLAGFLIFRYTQSLTLGLWICLSLIVAILGTFGDLIESKFKRQAGVKDSGRLMPGHGGIYDRLDSILYTSPFVFAVLEFVAHVS